jgi:hypothetical protein
MILQYFLTASIVYFSFLILVIVQLLGTRSKPKDWYKKGVKLETDDPKQLRFLYDEAQKMLTHYDNLNWQIGSILVGSNLVAMSFSLQLGRDSILVLALAISGMLSQLLWLLFFLRHMALYNLRSDVLFKIEEKWKINHHSLTKEVRSQYKYALGLIPGHVSVLILGIGFSTVWWLLTFFI